MNRIFNFILTILVFISDIVTPVFADEACDDALSDGHTAYNSGKYALAQKHFENVIKWCGNNYGDANDYVQKCKKKKSEQIEKQQTQNQKQQEQPAELERKGYMEIIDIKFANVKYDNTIIDQVGEKIYSDKLRFLKPIVYYNGLSSNVKAVEYDYKIFFLGGITSTGGNAKEIYKTESRITINVQPYKNQKAWLPGYGNESGGTYETGVYKFEFWHNGYKLFEKSFKVYSNSNIVTDCQGHTYPVVKIGDQYWMAENLQCTKYDTQSERAGATLSTSSSSTYAPYYTDGRNATINASGNLTSSHRRKLGLLYNWAATVGLATESEVKNRTTAFSGRRQGICPNGWHVPTSAEWNTLESSIGYAGKALKTTSGWYNNSNGTDTYSFAALPAGYAHGSTIDGLGCYAYFWTTTLDHSGKAYNRFLYCYNDNLYGANVAGNKDSALSVRCVRD